MTKNEIEKTFKIIFFSSIIYLVLFLVTTMILGRVINVSRFPDMLIYLSLFVAFGLFITGIINIIYYLKEKIYKNTLYGFGTIFFSLFIFLFTMIISIANTWN